MAKKASQSLNNDLVKGILVGIVIAMVAIFIYQKMYTRPVPENGGLNMNSYCQTQYSQTHQCPGGCGLYNGQCFAVQVGP